MYVVEQYYSMLQSVKRSAKNIHNFPSTERLKSSRRLKLLLIPGSCQSLTELGRGAPQFRPGHDLLLDQSERTPSHEY